MHKEAKLQGSAKDMDQAVRALKGEAGRREDLFQKSLDAQKHKSDRLKKTFDESFKRVQENPETPLPPREIDL
jgi:hypothetical protein